MTVEILTYMVNYIQFLTKIDVFLQGKLFISEFFIVFFLEFLPT